MASVAQCPAVVAAAITRAGKTPKKTDRKFVAEYKSVPELIRTILRSGTAGPLAAWPARGGGHICRSFVLGFGKWIAV